MKRLRLATLSVLALLTLAIGVLVPASHAYADVSDQQAIEQVNTSIRQLDGVLTNYDVADKGYNAEFYAAFVKQAVTTSDDLAIAYNKLDQTSETKKARIAVEQLRTTVGALREDVEKWGQAAAAKDDAAFNDNLNTFNAGIDDYNTAIQNYNEKVTKAAIVVVGSFYRILIGVTTAFSAAVAIWALCRNQWSKHKGKKLDNAAWMVALGGTGPLVGGAINYYINSSRTVDYTFILLALVPLGLVPFALMVGRYMKAFRNLPEEDNRSLMVTPAAYFWLTMVTFGMYPAYWAWKAWKVVSKAEGKKYNAAIRAIFLGFTSFGLFESIDKMAIQTGYKTFKDHQALAAGMLFSGVINYVGLRLNNPIVSLCLEFVSVALLAVLPLPMVRAYNHYLKHTEQRVAPIGSSWVIITAIVLSLASSFVFGLIIGIKRAHLQ